MKTIYDLIMIVPKLKRAVLIEFGFGAVKPKKVEQWVRYNYPIEYQKVKTAQQLINNALIEAGYEKFNVIPFEVEATTQQERSAFLDLALENFEDIISTKE